ncbi:Hemicentin-1 [Holothuria leucospilota]|uniref:Hemicentin-1 n=1 Tax=Holothuria leucospilota TaxID=206669 RepID=A0A9Q1BX91_HOLLE|nr:Hemicentin-1 [Holothuria leucospilota]
MDLRVLLVVVTTLTYFCDADSCFTPDVSKLLKKVGDSVSLYCSSGNDHIAAILKKDGIIITSGSNLVVEGVLSSEKVLRIFNVTRANEGTYTCNANINVCGSVELKVYDEITFPNEDKEKLQYIQAGRSGKITCTSKSTPDPTHEWYVDGRKIQGDGAFQQKGKHLQVVSATKLNASTFTCRANLKEFGYFKDLNITLSVSEGEPLSCLKCRQYDVGKADSVDNCVSAKNIDKVEQCHSSCVTITASGPSFDGNIRYASIRGCGDHVGVLKEKCMELPHPVIKMEALSLFGDFSGLTNADVCFCSSGDQCNNEAKVYKSPSNGVVIKGGIPTVVAALCLIISVLTEQ